MTERLRILRKISNNYMKKYIVLILCLAFSLVLCACDGEYIAVDTSSDVSTDTSASSLPSTGDEQTSIDSQSVVAGTSSATQSGQPTTQGQSSAQESSESVSSDTSSTTSSEDLQSSVPQSSASSTVSTGTGGKLDTDNPDNYFQYTPSK